MSNLPYTEGIIEKIQKVISDTKLQNPEAYNLEFAKGYEIAKLEIEKKVCEAKVDMLK